MTDPLLSIRGLTVRVGGHDGAPAILEDVDLDVGRAETVGLVGESGSGKSTLGAAILRLTPGRLAEGTRGEIRWKDSDLLTLSPRRMRRVRGREISMILQDPMSSLNPVQSVGAQVREALARAGRGGRDSAAALLDEVRIPAPEERLSAYPHQMSGGMRQRVVTAIGLAQDPALIVCDEPTTALDATVQVQILDLLRSLKDAHGMSMLFITHDFGVVARICDRVAVMYAGRIVETGPVADIFRAPAHPYSRALLAAVPRTTDRPDRLPAIEGQPPGVGARPSGCPFRTRCPKATDACLSMPDVTRPGPGRTLRCHHPESPA